MGEEQLSKNILITGCSSGLGLALTNLYLENEFTVFGISRNKPKIENKNFHFKHFWPFKSRKYSKRTHSFHRQNRGNWNCLFKCRSFRRYKRDGESLIDEIKDVLDVKFLQIRALDILAKSKVKIS